MGVRSAIADVPERGFFSFKKSIFVVMAGQAGWRITIPGAPGDSIFAVNITNGEMSCFSPSDVVERLDNNEASLLIAYGKPTT